MSQPPRTLAEQIAAERLKLAPLTPAQIDLNYQIHQHAGGLARTMSELTEMLGFGGLVKAVSLHFDVSAAPEVRAKSLAISAWSKTCSDLFELHVKQMLAAGALEDFDTLLATMPALEI